jgi:hypothetical protein
MFADDTQLFNKNDESVKKSFDILTIYEKASGSKVNFEKTKCIYIGSAKNKNNRPKFTKIVWTKDNVKTLGHFLLPSSKLLINTPSPDKTPYQS